MSDRHVTYEYDLDPDASNNTAATILRLARESQGAVLDLGSGPGLVSSWLVRDGRDVTCVDADSELLGLARDNGVENTVEADLEDSGWIDRVPKGPFGLIILADVLEHLREPARVLEAIREHELLADDGCLVISVPNVAHEAVIAGLLGQRFDYTDTGLLDATHIRFFTHDSLHSMLEAAGYSVTRLERTTRTLEQTEQFAQVEFVTTPLREAMRDHLRDTRTYQFIVRAEPRDVAHQLADLRRELDEARQQRIRERESQRAEHSRELQETHSAFEGQLAEARAAVVALEQDRDRLIAASEAGREERDRVIAEQAKDLTALRAEKDREVRTGRERIAALRAEAEELRQHRDEHDHARQHLQREVDRLQSKLDAVYESETWRVGRAVTWPVRAARGRASRPARSGRGRGSADDREGRRPRRRHVNRASYDLYEDRAARARYEEAVARRSFRRDDAVHVLVTVSTLDLDAGRGDIFTAVGLGLAAERHGYEFVYATEDEWYDPPEGTDVVLSLLAEPKLMLDPLQLPPGPKLVAWIRNNTSRWAGSPGLGLYDAVLCSSEATRREVANAYDGPLGILRIGVDAQLFARAEGPRHGVATTVNQWGRERATYRSLRETPIEFPLGIYGVQRQFAEELEPFRHGSVSYFSLPSLYAQAAIVLDDQQDVNRPYGNVNSRIFETLAVGALPVSNTAVGAALHLEELPVYDSPAEMHELVAAHLSDEAGRDALVATLQQRVLDLHTYDHRAQEFDGFVREHGLRGDGDGDATPVLTFQPDYRVTNPYQDLLYQALDGVAIVPVNGPRDVLESPRLLARPGVHHVHWTATVLGPAVDRGDAEDRCAAFLADLDRLRERGFEIVWTLHNVMPHECAHPEVERQLRQGLVDRCSAVHVMCERTVELAAPDYQIPADKVRVIPHGSYVDVYPEVVDRGEARRRLALPDDAPVVVCFGQVRPYKGIERLLDAFEVARGRDADLRLVVAGGLGRFPGVKDLARRIESTAGVTAHLEVVPDAEVQLYISASDAMVLPHERVLNSGGALLAWSFGRAVIAPRVGCLQDLVTDDIGRLFEADGTGLAEALADARRLGEADVHKAARAKAEAWTHAAMADAFSEIVHPLTGRSARP